MEKLRNSSEPVMEGGWTRGGPSDRP